MSEGPRREKRPADTNACAVMVGKIATGEVEDEMSSNRGSEGGVARAKQLSAARRTEIAKRAAGVRWSRSGSMSERSQSLHSFLFEEGRELVNIKFFPGSDRGLTKHRLEAAVNKALRSALLKGEVNEPPRTGRAKRKLLPQG